MDIFSYIKKHGITHEQYEKELADEAHEASLSNSEDEWEVEDEKSESLGAVRGSDRCGRMQEGTPVNSVHPKNHADDTPKPDIFSWDEIEIGQLALDDGKEVEVDGDKRVVRVIK